MAPNRAMLLGLLKENSQPNKLRDSLIKPLNTIQVIVAHAVVVRSKCKVPLGSHADTCLVGDSYLVLHDHNRSVDIYSYHLKDGHRSAKTVNAKVHYHNP